MLFYRIKEEKLYDYSNYLYAEDCLTTEIITSEEIEEHPNKVIVEDGKLILNPNYKEEEEKKEEERIAQLNLTGADVERGIYQAKGMDFQDVIEFVEKSGITGLDIKALKIELKANNFYRGNPYVIAVGKILGFTKEQLDMFFETGDYHYLLSES